MRTSTFTLCLVLLATSLVSAQTSGRAKRALTHDDYDGWKSLSGTKLSDDGRWVAVTVRPAVGDAELVVRSTSGGKTYRHPRGTGARFSADGRWVVFTIAASRADTLAYEKGKLAKGSSSSRSPRGGRAPDAANKEDGEKPTSSLGIMNLADGGVTVIDRVKGFRVPEEGPAFVVYHLEKPKSENKKGDGEKKAEKKPSRSGGSGGSKKTPDYLKDGTPLVIRDLASGSETRIEGVMSYGISRKKGICWFACNSKKDDEKVTRGLFAVALGTGGRTTLVEGAASYGGFATDREVTRLAFVSDRRDREAKKATFDLYAWDLGDEPAGRIVSHVDTEGFPEGRSVASARGSGSSGGSSRRGGRRGGGGGGSGLSFSRDGTALMFGAAELPKPELPKLLDEEKVTLDLWHWKDPLLQPMQAKQGRSRSLKCVWHFGEDRMTVVSAKDTDQVAFLTPSGTHALVHDAVPYAQAVSWDGRYSDAYVVDTASGDRTRVITELRGRATSSPDGKTLAFFRDDQWFAVDVSSGETVCLTKDLKVPFHREDDDRPEPAGAHGIAGWTEDGRVLINDRFDVWVMGRDGSKPRRVTDGWGRAKKTRLRYTRLDPEERFVPTDKTLMFAATNQETMASGYYTDGVDGAYGPEKVVMLDKRFGGLTKAKKAERCVYTLTTFAECGDLWTSGMDLAAPKRLTDINPQQKNVRWGKSELVRWRNADGVELKGFLVKPDGFDPKKKYPMMVYFYEKTSSGLHNYVRPSAGTSPNAAYYVSNGYLWFQPDIVYQDGYPGESCLKCVVSGVQHLMEQGFVDEEHVGAAGHSWGGYQTAYLITKTNIFAAVESGAPVSNMTSAYGGIRWGSGMSRAFQYEKTQSRIGGSLWEYPLRYLENSPLFSADKVRTPVLILHNDEDGAVPWYQGIEFFCALRRLGREAYMFNYVGDAHGIRRTAAKNDWVRRMQQYFDHHLKGAPAPEWMKQGVSYADREREKHRFNKPKHAVWPKKEKPAAAGSTSSGSSKQR